MHGSMVACAQAIYPLQPQQKCEEGWKKCFESKNRSTAVPMGVAGAGRGQTGAKQLFQTKITGLHTCDISTNPSPNGISIKIRSATHANAHKTPRPSTHAGPSRRHLLTNSDFFSYLPVQKKPLTRNMISIIQYRWQTKIQHTEGDSFAKIFFAKNDGSQIKEFKSTPICIIRTSVFCVDQTVLLVTRTTHTHVRHVRRSFQALGSDALVTLNSEHSISWYKNGSGSR